MKYSETRRHPRYTVEIAAELTVGMETVAAATQNVSEGGAALELELTLQQGSAVGLALFLTQDGIEDPDREPFEAQVTVAWVRPHERGFLAGVSFAEVTDAQRAQLRAFLAEID